jgi:hypothetical protein
LTLLWPLRFFSQPSTDPTLGIDARVEHPLCRGHTRHTLLLKLLLLLVKHRGELRLVKLLLCLCPLHLLLDKPLGKLGCKPIRVRRSKVLFKEPHMVARLKRHLCKLVYLVSKVGGNPCATV